MHEDCNDQPLPMSLDLEQLKESRKQLTNVFALLYKAKFEGSQSEAVFNALKFVDALVGKIQTDIVAQEPKAMPQAEVKPDEPSPAVEAAVQPAQA